MSFFCLRYFLFLIDCFKLTTERVAMSHRSLCECFMSLSYVFHFREAIVYEKGNGEEAIVAARIEETRIIIYTRWPYIYIISLYHKMCRVCSFCPYSSYITYLMLIKSCALDDESFIFRWKTSEEDRKTAKTTKTITKHIEPYFML